MISLGWGTRIRTSTNGVRVPAFFAVLNRLAIEDVSTSRHGYNDLDPFCQPRIPTHEASHECTDQRGSIVGHAQGDGPRHSPDKDWMGANRMRDVLAVL